MAVETLARLFYMYGLQLKSGDGLDLLEEAIVNQITF